MRMIFSIVLYLLHSTDSIKYGIIHKKIPYLQKHNQSMNFTDEDMKRIIQLF